MPDVGSGGASSSATDAFAVTPTDGAANFTYPVRAIYVGGGGDVRVQTVRSTVTFTAVPTGTVLPVQVLKVFATGTTATAIVGLI